MNASIRVRKTLVDDPRLAQIQAATGLDRDAVLGKLLRLWIWADAHASRGIAPGGLAFVDSLVDQPGFGQALAVAGWLEARLHEVCFLNYLEFARAPRRSRLAQADRQAQGEKAALVVPERLNTPGFRAVWQEWIEHRKALKKPLSPQAVKRQLAALVALGLKRAMVAIEHSIARNWMGIYEPSGPAAQARPVPTAQAPSTEEDQRLATVLKNQQEQAARLLGEEERLRRERESEPVGSFLFRGRDHDSHKTKGEGEPGP
jgi:hypothetical protein